MITLRRLRYYDPEQNVMLNRFDIGPCMRDDQRLIIERWSNPKGVNEDDVAVAVVEDLGREAEQFAVSHEIPHDVLEMVRRHFILNPNSVGALIWDDN